MLAFTSVFFASCTTEAVTSDIVEEEASISRDALGEIQGEKKQIADGEPELE